MTDRDAPEQCMICDRIFPIKLLVQFLPNRPDQIVFKSCIDCAGEMAEDLRGSGCPACLILALNLDNMLSTAISSASDDELYFETPHDVPHLPNCPRRNA